MLVKKEEVGRKVVDVSLDQSCAEICIGIRPNHGVLWVKY